MCDVILDSTDDGRWASWVGTLLSTANEGRVTQIVEATQSSASLNCHLVGGGRVPWRRLQHLHGADYNQIGILVCIYTILVVRFAVNILCLSDHLLSRPVEFGYVASEGMIWLDVVFLV